MKKEKVKFDLRQEAFRKMEQMHPHLLLLYVSLIGSAIIFLFMAVAFTAANAPLSNQLAEFPKAFMVSTVVMLLSSFSATRIIPAYEKDDMEALKKWLGITFLLGLIFACCQLLGWHDLQAHNIVFISNHSGAYLYVISGLHILHLVAILIYALSLLLKCNRVSLDPVQQLMYVTNPYQKIRFKILVEFWHYVDVVWITLFFYFLFTF